ncbi:MAG TPA: cupin domain-containing protein [Dehalococcoidia bacterium]|nr:cupin domain-containing protein [Dehalococcoidia bacterium]
MQYVRPVDFAAFKPTEFHSQRIADRSSGIESCICICTRVPRGTCTTNGPHTHSGDQFYYVTRGRMTLEIDGQVSTADTGSLVFIPAGSPHWNWNDGAEEEVHFELIVPSPEAGAPISTTLAAVEKRPSTEPAPSPHVTRLDPSGFNPERFSQLTLRGRSNGSSHCRFMVARVPPGGKSPDLHIHRFDQFYYLLTGTMQLQIGLAEMSAGADTLVVLPAGVPHRNWNNGAEDETHVSLQVPENREGERADYAVRLEAIGGT